jgi:hypothetical protein
MQNSRFLRANYCLLWSLLLTLAGADVLGQQILQPADLVAEEEAEAVRRYSVELIIFQYNDPNVSGTEIFLADELPAEEAALTEFEQDADGKYFADLAMQPQPMTNPDGAADGTEVWPPFSADELVLAEIPSFQQIGLRVMQPDEFVLNDIYDKLEELNAYTPLLRTAWVQETIAEEETRPIKLRRLGGPPLSLDGHVSLYLGRYLHLVLDIALEERTPLRSNGFASADPVNNARYGNARYDDNRIQAGNDYDLDGFGNPRRTGSVFYRIQEDRIVRNGELRYYDHPRFGAIAKITRIEESEARPGENAPDRTADSREINQSTP